MGIFSFSKKALNVFKNFKISENIRYNKSNQRGHRKRGKDLEKDTYRINQIVRISKLYYECNLGQVQIAEKEGISKSTVSRLLKMGKDLGIIEVHIKEPAMMYTDLEDELTRRFPLKRATIVPVMVDNPQIVLNDVCAALIADLPRYLENDATLGIAWGTTLESLSAMLPHFRCQGISVLQLTGGYSRLAHETSALSILQRFASSVDGDAYVIPAPAIVDTPDIAQAIEKDSQIQKVMTMAKRCQTAIYSAGAFGRPSVIFEMGIIDDAQYAKMAADGCVGDCCGHFLNAQGEIFDEALDRRVVGVSLDTIRNIPHRLLIASDPRKGKVLKAALQGHMASHLYVDVKTAEAILK